MFSMFFGAGNVVFPLALGQYAQDHNFYAVLGLLITGVMMPFIGLIAVILFQGKYQDFFGRLGKIPGFLLALLMLGIIGPFGAIPRCIALSYSTIHLYLPHLSLPFFSLITCLIIFLFTFKRNNIVDILGYFLTPILLLCLFIIIIKGITFSPEILESPHSKVHVFWVGIKEGYQTMDLIGAFFFSSVVLACINREDNRDKKSLILLSLEASLIGIFLLSIVYIGFSFVAAFQSENLVDIAKEEIAGAIAIHVLGSYGGIVTCTAVSLACLTTAIALSSVFAEFLFENVTFGKMGYCTSLFITLAITYLISILHFEGISNFLTPILQVCYPALIVLSILNILYKLFDFTPVKVPVLVVFLISLVAYTIG